MKVSLPCGWLTRAGYQNHHPFDLALHRFLWDSSRCCRSSGYGWLDGGCLILCDAFVKWGNGALYPGGIVRKAKTGDSFLDHAFAFIESSDSQSRILIDGDGLQSSEVMRRKFSGMTYSKVQELVYSDCSRLAVSIPRNPSLSARIALSLEKAFGPFSVELLRVQTHGL